MHSGAPSQTQKARCKLKRRHFIYKFVKKGARTLWASRLLRPCIHLFPRMGKVHLTRQLTIYICHKCKAILKQRWLFSSSSLFQDLFRNHAFHSFLQYIIPKVREIDSSIDNKHAKLMPQEMGCVAKGSKKLAYSRKFLFRHAVAGGCSPHFLLAYTVKQ